MITNWFGFGFMTLSLCFHERGLLRLLLTEVSLLNRSFFQLSVKSKQVITLALVLALLRFEIG